MRSKLNPVEPVTLGPLLCGECRVAAGVRVNGREIRGLGAHHPCARRQVSHLRRSDDDWRRAGAFVAQRRRCCTDTYSLPSGDLDDITERSCVDGGLQTRYGICMSAARRADRPQGLRLKSESEQQECQHYRPPLGIAIATQSTSKV